MDRLLSMRVFDKVATEGSFAAAARELDMSSPVVTRLVADLEAHLGTRLLQRTTRRLALTEAGQQYLHRVRGILQDIDEAEALAGCDTQQLAGKLKVYAPPVLASYVIAPLLADFTRQYPHIQVLLTVESAAEPPVEDHDLTLIGADAQLSDQVVAKPIVEADAVLVAAPSYLARSPALQHPQDLLQHACLRLRGNFSSANTRSQAWRLWQPQQPEAVELVPINPVVVANHTDTLLRAVVDGAGITSVSLDIAAALLAQGAVVRVLKPWVTGHLVMHAAMPSRKFVPQRTRVFLDFLIERTRASTQAAVRDWV